MQTEMKRLDPRSLKLLDVNARFMTHEQFQAMVVNVKRDRKLTSVPFAWWNGEKYEVLSGNHRTKVAIAAGLEEIDVMVTHDELSPDERLAIQISHNAIVGQDDPAILKQLYESIADIDMKVYCGLDDKTLELLDEVSPVPFSEAGMEVHVLNLLFLPDELERAEKVIDDTLKLVSGKAWLLRNSAYDKWLDSVAAAGGAQKIKNSATAVMSILNVFERHLADLNEHLEARTDDDYFPVSVIAGSPNIPVATAKLLRAAIRRLIDSGQAKTEAEALHKIAEASLAV
jgi:hypothetical protein